MQMSEDNPFYSYKSSDAPAEPVEDTGVSQDNPFYDQIKAQKQMGANQQAIDEDSAPKPVLSPYQQRMMDINAQGQAIAKDSSSFVKSTNDFLDAFNKQMGDLPRGILQKLSGVFSDSFNKSVVQQQTQAEEEQRAALHRSPYAAGAGAVVGGLGNAFTTAVGTGALAAGAAAAMPAVAAGLGEAAVAHPLLAGMATSAAGNAAYMGANYTPEGQDTGRNMAEGALIGAIIPPAVAVGSHIAHDVVSPLTSLAGKMINPEKEALKTVGDRIITAATPVETGITPTGAQAADTLLARAAPSKALNIPTSPAEIMGSVNMATKEGGLGKTEAAQATVEPFLGKRQYDMKQRLNDVINKIVPEGSPDDVQQMISNNYDSFKPLSVLPEQQKTLLSNPIISTYLADLNKSMKTPQSLVEMPNNNVYKLNEINKIIGEDLFKNVSSVTKDAGKTLNPTDRLGLNEARTLLRNTLDDAVPNGLYKKNLDLVSRNKDRTGLLQNIDDIAAEARAMSPDGNVKVSTDLIYKKLFATPTQQDNFIKMVKDSGGDTEVAQNVITTLNQTLNTPLNKILSGTRVAAETNHDQASHANMISEAIKSIVTGNYENEILKLSIGGHDSIAKIAGYLKGLKSESLGERIISLHGALDALKSPVGSKVVTQGVNQGVLQPMMYGTHHNKIQTGYLSQ